MPDRDVPRYSLRTLFVLTAMVGLFLTLGSLTVRWLDSQARTPTRRSNCVNNLKQIGIALQNYHDTHRCFPPAYFADANGRPMHSWRVILLPFFEEQGLKALYKAYDFNEPWNGPNNRKLADRMPVVYCCPSVQELNHQTSYLAIVGSETGWPGTSALDIRQIKDGTSNTIAVTEIAEPIIHWMEPRDLTLDEAAQGINPPLAKLSASSHHGTGSNVLFFDGAVHYLRNETPLELLRGLMTANGGENVTPPDN